MWILLYLYQPYEFSRIMALLKATLEVKVKVGHSTFVKKPKSSNFSNKESFTLFLQVTAIFLLLIAVMQ